MQTSFTSRTSFGAKKAFTLIELLVVIAIIAILAAILFPVFARARENARRSSCQSNLKQIGLGVMQYSQDYDEAMLPLRWSWSGAYSIRPFPVLLQPYVKSTQIFKCPSNTATGFMNDTSDTSLGTTPANFMPGIPVSYAANAGSNDPGEDRAMQEAAAGNISLASFNNPATTITIVENKNNPYADFYDNGRATDLQGHLGTSNFLFADGHVKSLKPLATGTPICMYTRNNAALRTATTTSACNAGWVTSLGTSQTNMN
ncbi:hypothetical protein IAD21_04212 [Abditibacteriota bacterium]|nr:hypothetical protein IAD21_04212 [Abditibacteriota bacterium]